MITYTFGLTGGIASGKSTVASLLREMGVPIIDADSVSRDVMEPGSEGLQMVCNAFGPSILNLDGSLNRAALGEIVMNDSQARDELNAITHPLIRAEIKNRIDTLHVKRKVAVVVEAALLIETGSHVQYHGLILVTCPRELQRERLMLREGFDAETAARWIDAQMPLEEKIAIAESRKGSWIINNDLPLDLLREKIMSEWPQYYRVISTLLI